MRPLREKSAKQKKIRILIIRLKPAGDTILISSVFRNLKNLFPDSEVDIVLYPSCREAVGANPHLNRVLVLRRNNLSKLFFYLRLPFLRYAITLDFINNPTSCLISLFSLARIRIGRDLPRNFFYNRRYRFKKEEYSALQSLKVLHFLGLKKFGDYMPEYFIPDEAEKTASGILGRLGVGSRERLVAIFASAKYPTRQYPALSYLRLALRIRKDFKVRILFLFGRNDKASGEAVKRSLENRRGILLLPDDISLATMAAVIKRTRYLVTNDTGPKHLGTALGIPTLTIFGATDDRVWNPPDRKRFLTVRSKVPCSPCQALSCATLECMRDLSPDDVYRMLKPALKKYLV